MTMRVRLALIFMGLALAAPAALGQATQAPVPGSRCPSSPAAPTLPDGATARNSREIREADAAYQAWGIAAKAALDCRAAEVAELLPAARQHQARVAEYNAQAQGVMAVSNAWTAEVAEYNARTTGAPAVAPPEQQPFRRQSDRE
jgi:hypothetical protein